MAYSAGEAAAKLGLSKDGLRYYEKEGIIPPIARDKTGHRVYSESDIDWIYLIRCLRDTDMPICKIRQYVSFAMEGGIESIPKRREMLKEHGAILAEKIKIFQNLQSLIEKKVEFFDKTINADNPEAIHCMDYSAEWEQFKLFLGGIKHD